MLTLNPPDITPKVRSLFPLSNFLSVVAATLSLSLSIKMASIGKIHTYQSMYSLSDCYTNHSDGIRSAYVQAVAAFAGVKVEEVVHENIFAEEELKAKFAAFLVPAFEGADGINIIESGAIAAHGKCLFFPLGHKELEHALE